MLKMERGAARSASRNTRVVDMEELKKAREQRASSARHPSEQARENKREYKSQAFERPFFEEQDKPFWEQETPFEEQDKPFWQQERPFRGAEDSPGKRQQTTRQTRQPAGRQAERDDGHQPRQADRRKAAKNDSQPPLPQGSRQPARDSRFQARQDERQPAGRANTKSGHAGLQVLLILLGLLAIAAAIGLKVFEVQNIDVKGAETISKESIIALSGIGRGENIFKVSLGQARQNLESDPLVEVIGISRIFPDKIKIEIRQRQPHGAIAWLGSYVIIDEKGFVVDVRDSLPVGQYPLITGIDIEPSEKGKPLVGVTSGEKELMYKLLSALHDKKALQYISEVSLADTGRIIMLTGEGMQIDIGKPSDLDKKAQWIACSVPELRSKGYTTGILYVTGTNSPVFSATLATEANAPEQGGDVGGEGDEGSEAAANGEDNEADNITADEGGNEDTGPDNAA